MRRITIALTALALTACLAGSAAAAVVTTRVEGRYGTIYNGQLSVGKCSVRDNLGTYHTLNRPVALGALNAAAERGAFSYVVKNFPGFGLFIDSVAGQLPTGAYGWMYRVNYRSTYTAAADLDLRGGEEVLWYFAEWDDKPIELKPTATVINRGGVFKATAKVIKDDGTRVPLPGAYLRVGKRAVKTDSSGLATMPMSYDGKFGVVCEKGGYIRSRRYVVSVAPRPIVSAVSDAPDPFTPNGDGSADKSFISFNLSRTSRVALVIKNSKGVLVRTLLNNGYQTAGAKRASWDGKTGLAKAAPAGTYRYEIRAIDSEGRKASPYPAYGTVKLNR